MKISKLIIDFIKDFVLACGGLTIIIAIMVGSTFVKSFNSSYLWQIMLISAALVFFKYALYNKYELTNIAQAISFTVFSCIGDGLVFIWILLFSPTKIVDITLVVLYLGIFFVVKLAIFWMLFIDGKRQTERLNQKLNELGRDDR